MNKSLLSKWFEQGAFFFLTLLSNSDPKLYLRYIYWANSKIILRSLCLHHSHGHLSKWLDDKNNNCHATLPLWSLISVGIGIVFPIVSFLVWYSCLFSTSLFKNSQLLVCIINVFIHLSSRLIARYFAEPPLILPPAIRRWY